MMLQFFVGCFRFEHQPGHWLSLLLVFDEGSIIMKIIIITMKST